MKTSTKNALITGIFSIIAAAIGTLSFSIGKTTQNEKIETAINESGVITIKQNESSSEVIERLLDEYVQLQNDYNSISIKYTDLENEYDLLNQNNKLLEIDKNQLQEDLNSQTEENEKLMSQISGLNSNNLTNINNNDNAIFIKNVVKDDSFYYYEQERFVDVFGNTYPLAYRFDASHNAFVTYDLREKYSVLTGNITLSQQIGDDALMIVEIYGDNYKLLKRIENISKSLISNPISLESIDVSGVNKLTINTYNSGSHSNGLLYLTDVKLQ